MSVSPSNLTVLNVSPYNTFTLNCTVTLPTSLVSTITTVWTETTSGALLNSNGDNINITTFSSETVIHLFLNVRTDTVGQELYRCSAMIQPPYDAPITQAESSNVIVKGIIILLYKIHCVHIDA